MSAVFYGAGVVLSGMDTGDSLSCGSAFLLYERLPTDPLFYAALTLQNVIVGSRYRITRHDTGAQLATGVVSSPTEVITGIPCFANPMQLDVYVRNASGGTKYKPFETAAFLVSAGASAYILQQLD